VLAELITEGADVADIGSGAGLPGLVLAVVRPDLRLTLVEPLLRRTAFLQEAVDRLGLDTVEVVRARAEELHGKREFSVVTSRAVAPLDRLLDWSMPLVRQGGTLLAMKGSSAAEEIESASARLRRHGAGRVEVLTCGAGVVDPPTSVVRVEAGRPSRLGYERASKPPKSTQESRQKSRRKSGRKGRAQ
jgi:16S rRNA (guanine527-N7)-methyltransferase